MVDSSGASNFPVTNEKAQNSTWMSSLARATNGVKTRATCVEDLEGLAEMFATPPTVHVSSKDISKQQKGSNWLSSLAKATKAPRKRGIPVEDFEGVAEMFATPPSTLVVTPRNTTEGEGDTSSPDEPELHMAESLKPSKTPSLRSFGKDAEFVEIVTPIQSSRTPSLRSGNKQTIKTAVTPEVMLEMKEVLLPQKTPSLRSSVKDAVTIQVVTPLQPSRTPSLRSAKQQSSVFCSESPEVEMEVVQPIAPSKTPSMRSSAQVKAVSTNDVKKPSASDRKSLGLKGLARLMKSPKENNAVENAEDFFAPNMFASPKPQPKRYSRKSEGLQGVARLLRTPHVKNEEAAVHTEKAVASPNFVGLRMLMRTPKASEKPVDPEEHFSSELFASPAEDSSQDAAETAGHDGCDKKQDVPVINLISPESQEETVKRSEGIDSEAVPRVKRAKRKAPEELTKPAPKRVRTTRAAVKQSDEGKTETRSIAKAAHKKTTTRSKKSTEASVQNTPKPLVFKRTQLDPIIEVMSPLPSFDHAVEIADSPALVEPDVAEKASNGRSAKKATEAKVQSKEALRSSRRGNRAKAKVESSEESSGEEVAEKRAATRSRTSGKGQEKSSSNGGTQKAGVKITEKNGGKTRATRGTQLKEAPSQNVPLPSKTRASRNKRVEVEDKDVNNGVTEETGNNPPSQNVPLPSKTRASRNKRVEDEDKDVNSGVTEETVNNPPSQNVPLPSKTRASRNKKAKVAEVEDKDVNSGVTEGTVNNPPSQNVPLPSKTRASRNKKAKVAEVEDKDVNSGVTEGTVNNPPSQNVPLPSKTRASRNKKAEVAEAEDKDVNSGVTEETVNNPITRRSRRAAKTTEECVPVMAEKKTTRSQKTHEKKEETPQVRCNRSRRGAVNESKTVDEEKLPQTSQPKQSKKESVEKLDEKVKSKEIEARAEHRSTRRKRGNPAEKAVPESSTASLHENENVQSDNSAKKPRAKREPKGKTPEEPKKPRSTRNAKPAKTEVEVEVEQPTRSTRGAKRHLHEEDAVLAAPEAKRTRSSVQAPQTRSLRSRK